MPSGGARANAGRPKKPAAQKALEGNRGKRPIEVLEFASGEDIPKIPPVYLSDKAKEIYIKVVEWLYGIGCTKGILPYNLEEYAHCKSRWLEAEEMNFKHGLLIKSPNGQASKSPFIEIAQMYLRQTNEVWAKIYTVVRESKLSEWDPISPNDEIEKMLSNQFKK